MRITNANPTNTVRRSASAATARALPLVLAAAVSLAACSLTSPLTGTMERSNEPLTGSVSGNGYRAGSGVLTIVTQDRVECRGDFVYTSRRRAEGVLRCDDGRTGTFRLAVVAGSGSGAGELVGQRFTFTFTTS